MIAAVSMFVPYTKVSFLRARKTPGTVEVHHFLFSRVWLLEGLCYILAQKLLLEENRRTPLMNNPVWTNHAIKTMVTSLG